MSQERVIPGNHNEEVVYQNITGLKNALFAPKPEAYKRPEDFLARAQFTFVELVHNGTPVDLTTRIAHRAEDMLEVIPRTLDSKTHALVLSEAIGGFRFFGAQQYQEAGKPPLYRACDDHETVELRADPEDLPEKYARVWQDLTGNITFKTQHEGYNRLDPAELHDAGYILSHTEGRAAQEALGAARFLDTWYKIIQRDAPLKRITSNPDYAKVLEAFSGQFTYESVTEALEAQLPSYKDIEAYLVKHGLIKLWRVRPSTNEIQPTRDPGKEKEDPEDKTSYLVTDVTVNGGRILSRLDFFQKQTTPKETQEKTE